MVATRSRSSSASSARLAGGAANDLRIDSGHARPRCRACRWRSRPRRAGARCARRPAPTRPGPSSTASACCAANSSAVSPLRARLVRVDPGPEVLGAELREGQQQVAEVALGVDRRSRGCRRWRPPRAAQRQRPGLAAAGHADADGVRDEVARVVEQPAVAALARGRGRTAGRGRRRRASRSPALWGDFNQSRLGLSSVNLAPALVAAGPAVPGVAGGADEAVFDRGSAGQATCDVAPLELEGHPAAGAPLARRRGRVGRSRGRAGCADIGHGRSAPAFCCLTLQG